MREWWSNRPGWQKIVIVVVGLIVVGGIVGGGDEEPTVEGEGAGDVVAAVTTTTSAAEATTTTAPTMTEAPATTASTAASATSSTTSTISTTTTSSTTTTTVATTTTEPVASFGDGTWLVGEDLDPGVYETTGDVGSFGCYWERLSGLSGDLDDILANDNADTHAIVEVAPGDEAFSSQDCGRWVELGAADHGELAEIPPGTWAVGLHIQPGRYRTQVTEGDFCYWERLAGFSGTLDDIVANDNVTAGQAIVDIAPGDAGFSSSGCGIWEAVG